MRISAKYEEKFKEYLILTIITYFATVVMFTTYYSCIAVGKYSFCDWFFVGTIAIVLKALFWPYYIFLGG